MFDKGFFGGLFDFNGDGELDALERIADFAAFANLISSTDNSDDDGSDNIYGEDDDDDF